MIRPFQTALWTLSAGTAMIAVLALPHGQTPSEQPGIDVRATCDVALVDDRPDIEDAPVPPAPSAPTLSSPNDSIVDAAIAADAAPARAGEPFRDASDSAGSDLGARIHLAPPDVETDSDSNRGVESTAPTVGTPADATARAASRSRDVLPPPPQDPRVDPFESASVPGREISAAVRRRRISRIYRPRTMRLAEIEPLLRPLLTAGVGTMMTKASGAGPATEEREPAARVAESAGELLVVCDLPEAVRRMDALYYDLDAVPKRIVIDALIVELTATSGASTGSRPAIERLDSELSRSRSGVRPGDPWTVLEGLRTGADARIVASNQLHVFNRHWTELSWTESRPAADGQGADESSPARQLAALSSKVRIRPVFLNDGMVRLEVHPQVMRLAGVDRFGQPELETLAFTTDVVVREGSTAVIAGFIIDAPLNGAQIEAAPPTGGAPNEALLSGSPPNVPPGPSETPVAGNGPASQRSFGGARTVVLLAPRIAGEP